MHQITTVPLVIALASVLLACKGETSSTRQSGPESASGAVAPSGQPGAGKSAPGKRRVEMRARRRSELGVRAKALLSAWVEAQNRADSGSYLAFYDNRRFKGVRRTHNGKVKVFDFRGWKQDRLKMFKLKNMVVAAEEVEVQTWLDPDTKLDKGVVLVRFIQRWRGGKYADHGIKVLHFWLDGKNNLRIVYEDLLNSERGWDRTPQAHVAALAWPVPKTQGEAMQRWRELAITAADYHDKLAGIPAQSALARALAEALIRAGGFACTRTVDYGSCGVEELEFAPLQGREDFADPCVRRRLLPWATEQLTAAQMLRLRAELLAIAALAAPEKEALEAVLIDPLESLVEAQSAYDEALEQAVASKGKRPEPPQLDELSDLVVELFERADDARIPDDIDLSLGEVPLALQIRLYREAKVERAAVALAGELKVAEGKAVTEVYEAVMEAIADASLSSAVRIEILSHLEVEGSPDTKALTTALSQAATSADCQLVGMAVDMLIEIDEKRYTPRRPTSNNPDDYARILCLLLQVEMDSAQANDIWTSLLPAKGAVEVSHSVEDLDYEMWQREAEEAAEQDRQSALDGGEDLGDGEDDGQELDDGDEQEGQGEGLEDGVDEGEDEDEDGAIQTDTETLTRAQSSLDDLASGFSAFGDTVARCRMVRDGKSFTCATALSTDAITGRDDGAGLALSVVGLSGSDSISVTFSRAADGTFYISDLERYETTGCPC